VAQYQSALGSALAPQRAEPTTATSLFDSARVTLAKLPLDDGMAAPLEVRAALSSASPPHSENARRCARAPRAFVPSICPNGRFSLHFFLTIAAGVLQLSR